MSKLISGQLDISTSGAAALHGQSRVITAPTVVLGQANLWSNSQNPGVQRTIKRWNASNPFPKLTPSLSCSSVTQYRSRRWEHADMQTCSPALFTSPLCPLFSSPHSFPHNLSHSCETRNTNYQQQCEPSTSQSNRPATLQPSGTCSHMEERDS